MSDSGELDRVVPKLQLLVARLQIPNAMDEVQRYDDYRYIGEAILSGDGDFAEFVARRHIRHAIDSLQNLPDPHFRGET
jgi:DNA-binding FadR family transcriptional regulator